MVQVVVPLGSSVHPDVEETVKPEGSVVVETTFEASDGPAFDTVTV